MKLDSTRQWLALIVLILAGVGSLATTPARPRVERTIDGRTSADEAGGRLTGYVALNADAAEIEGQLTLRLEARSGTGLIPPLEARIADIGNGPLSAPWQRLPLEAAVARGSCPSGQECRIPFVIELRPRASISGSLTVEWRLTSSLEYGFSRPGTPELSLVVTSPATPSMPELALVFAAAGAALAAAFAWLVARATRHVQRLRALDIAGAGAVLGVAAVLAHGAIFQHIPAEPAGAWLVVGAVALGRGLLRPGSGRVPAYLLCTAMFGLPLMLIVITLESAYRVPDVAVSMAGLGALAVLGTVRFAWSLGTRQAVPLAELAPGSRLTVASACAVLALLAGWSIAVAAGLTDYFALLALWPLLAVAFLAWALWRWLTGRPMALVYSGVLLVPFATLGGIGAVISFFSILGPPAPPVVVPAVLSYIVIGAAGILLAVSGPPRRHDGSVWSPLRTPRPAAEASAAQTGPPPPPLSGGDDRKPASSG